LGALRAILTSESQADEIVWGPDLLVPETPGAVHFMPYSSFGFAAVVFELQIWQTDWQN
jgi:hypothetical protein